MRNYVLRGKARASHLCIISSAITCFSVNMCDFILHSLPKQGRLQIPDTDHVLASLPPSQLLLINLVPGLYSFESHARTEYILCLSGTLVMEDEAGQHLQAGAGEMIEIAPGLRHRFASVSDAVIMTVAQNA